MYIFVSDSFVILVVISLVPITNGPIDNRSALVQIMAWRRLGERTPSETMLT